MLSWKLLQKFSKLNISHHVFAAIAFSAGWNNIVGSIAAAFDGWYLVFSLKFDASLSTVGTSMMVSIKDRMPLLYSQSVRKIFSTRNATLFIIIASLWIGASIISLILKHFFMMFEIVFLHIFSAVLLSFWLLISGAIKFSYMFRLVFSALSFIVGMILFHVLFGITSLTKPFGVLLFDFSALFTDDRFFSAPLNTGAITIKAERLRARIKNFSAVFACFRHGVFLSFSPCNYSTYGVSCQI